MNYYDLIYDYNHSDDWMFLLIDENKLPFGRYDVDEEKQLPVDRIFCTVDEKQTGYCDYLANDLVWLVVSEKVKTIMEGMNIGKCRFIDMVEEKSGKVLGYLVHCMNHLDVFDEERSMCGHFTDGSLMVIKPAIRGDEVGGLDVFMLKDYKGSYYISERLKKALQKNKCIGFDFMKIKS